MLFINYTKDGKAFRDHEAEKFAREAYDLSKQNDYLVDFATENFLYAVRVLVCRKVIPCEDVKILYEGKEFGGDLNKNGRLTVWPPGFCDNSENWLSELCHSKN